MAQARARAGRDEPGRRRSARAALRRCAARSVHIIPHGIPDMAPRDQDELKAKFGVAGHRMLLTFGLLGPEQGHRDGDPRAARRRSRACPGSRLLRRRGDAPGDRPPARRGLPHDARARGGEAGRARPRRVSRSVRHHRRAVQLPAGGRRLRQPLPQRGAGHERRAVLRDGRGRGGGVDALLARARSCSPTGAAACSRSATAPRWRTSSSRCWPRRPSSARDQARGVRVHARVHLAAHRRAATWSSAATVHGRAPRAARRAEAAARQQPARAAPRSSAAHDRRHRHHPARHVQRAGARRAATASTTTRAR